MRLLLTEAIARAPLGTTVSWRTPAGPNMGVVIGTEGDELITVSLIDRSLANDPSEQPFLDQTLTAKMAPIHGIPRVAVDVHRVPKGKAFFQHKIKGMNLRPYVKMARALRGKGESKEEPSPLVKDLQGVFG